MPRVRVKLSAFAGLVPTPSAWMFAAELVERPFVAGVGARPAVEVFGAMSGKGRSVEVLGTAVSGAEVMGSIGPTAGTVAAGVVAGVEAGDVDLEAGGV